MINNIHERFDEIVKWIENEDYERCTASALKFLIDFKNNNEASTYQPYVLYLKLFAEGYHTWQISYKYREVRSKFKLAHFLLEREIQAAFEDEIPNEHAILVNVLGSLSSAICAYTWCENSFINNDPFLLKKYSKIAVQEESSALNLLSEYSPSDNSFKGFSNWLQNYLQKNLWLHLGFNHCSEIYLICT